MNNHRILNYFSLILALFFVSISAKAQVKPIDLMSIGYGHNLDSENGADFTDVGISGLLPLITKRDKALISFPYFTYSSIKNSGLKLPGNNYYQVGLPLALQTSISARKKLGIFVLPTFSSDFSHSDKKNFNLSAALFLGNKPTSSFVFRYGVYYSHHVNGQLLIPIFNYYWSPTERFRIDGTNPLNPRISYQLAPKYRFGLEFDYRTKLYNISKGQSDRYLTDTKGIVASYFDINITKKLVMNIKGGYTFKRKIEVYEGVDRSSWYTGFKDRTPLKSLDQEGWFIKGGLKFQITPSLN